MISYAQNFEDVILHRCFKGRKDGFYIDVGAMDPMLDSVTKFFYDEGWSGINIEPNPWFYSKLLEDRPRDINLNLAIGEREESRLLHVFEQYGISTFEEAHRDRFIEQGFQSIEKEVRLTTLAAICQEYVRREIDFLKIDCEGWETFAIKGADWDRFRPIVVLVEATEPLSTKPSWSEWEPLLTENGRYEMVCFDGLNRFYLRREYSNLRCHFKLPPNVFDEFTVNATEQARQQGVALRQEQDALTTLTAELEEKLTISAAENQRCSQLASASAARMVETEGKFAGLAEEITGITAENGRLAESLELSMSRVAELELKAVESQAHVASLERECRDLEEQIRKTRLWVGQLSQDLASSKQLR